MKTKRTKKQSSNERSLDLQIENLEPRQMLAGNVTAFINGAGALIINGDGGDNQILVEVGESGDVTVTGQDDEVIDDSGLQDAQLSGDIMINLRGGDDSVYVTGPLGEGDEGVVPLDASFVDDIRIVGGSGNDRLGINAVNGATGNLTLSGGSGDDNLSLNYAETSGDVTIIGGSGNDTASVFVVGAEDITLITGGGDDMAGIVGSVASGSLNIRGGSGDDLTALKYSEGRNVNIISGGGDDTVSAADNMFAITTLQTGGGNDTVDILENFGSTGALRVVTGGGNDEVELTSNVEAGGFTDSAFILGGGNDSLRLGGEGQFPNPIIARGGAGTDSLTLPPGLTINELGFESDGDADDDDDA